MVIFNSYVSLPEGRFVVARSGSTNHQAVKPQDVTRAMSKALDAEQVEEEEARHRCCGDVFFFCLRVMVVI
jgi:hypothetical protein